MNLAQHSKTCRLCLSTTDIVVPRINKDLVNKIFECTGILVDLKAIDMPCALCKKCDKKLGMWSEFREQCTTINNMLYDKNEGMDEIEVDGDVDIDGQQEYPIEDTIEINDSDEENEHKEKNTKTGNDQRDNEFNEFLIPKIEPLIRLDVPDEIGCLHECNECNRKFMTDRILKDHRLEIHGIKKFICTLCSYATNRSSDFLRHKRRVHKITDLLYKCELCLKSYFDPSNLSAHLRSHSKDTTYCKVCRQSFNSVARLMKHQEVHLANDEFQCVVCSKMSDSKMLFKKHFRIHLK